MPQLYPAAVERLEKMLNALEPEIKEMTGQSPKFVRDQIERFARYGAEIFISPRQMEWLENLYEKHVGPLDGLGSGHDDGRDNTAPRGEVLGDDMDDEIPF